MTGLIDSQARAGHGYQLVTAGFRARGMATMSLSSSAGTAPPSRPSRSVSPPPPCLVASPACPVSTPRRAPSSPVNISGLPNAAYDSHAALRYVPAGQAVRAQNFILHDRSSRLVGPLSSPCASVNETLRIVMLVSHAGTPVWLSSTRLWSARPPCQCIHVLLTSNDICRDVECLVHHPGGD
jgi:hypothetical protein